MVSNKNVCEKCDVRIPKNRPNLICYACNCIKHLKCNNLTRGEALDIIESSLGWLCQTCQYGALPINAIGTVGIGTNPKIKKEKLNCHSCTKKVSESSRIAKCQWCDNRCHIKCVNRSLGCKKCCLDIIPGFLEHSYKLFDASSIKLNKIFNPYDKNHLINQLGSDNDSLDGQNVWSDMSDKLLGCKYCMLNRIPTAEDGNLRIFSLNIRSLVKYIDNLREDVAVLQTKFDLLCFCETNCKFESLPNGLADIDLDGFYEPIIQDPYRESGNGGGLVIYVNKKFCDSESFKIMQFKGVRPGTKFPGLSGVKNPTELNPAGEFLFIKISVKTQPGIIKTVIVGNIYRSPSAKIDKFKEQLDTYLSQLNRHKNKSITLVGDFNVDLLNHDTDIHGQNLINLAESYGFVQVVSLPTRLTDHSATLIDHIYTNSIHAVSTSRVITLDISDHFGTYVCISLDPNFIREENSTNSHDEYVNFRKFTATNMATFTELINGENWDTVYAEKTTEEMFETFLDKYNQHYDTAFPESSVRRKYERKNPKPWILPWLEEACARKQKFHHDYVVDPTPENEKKYKKMKKFTDKHVKKAKSKFYNDYFVKHKGDSRRQWQLLNSLLNRKRKRLKIDKIRDCDGNVYSSPQTIAQKFNDYFVNMAGKLKTGDDNSDEFSTFLENSVENSIYLSPTNETEVSSIIKQLKVKATSDTNIAAVKKADESRNFSRVVAEIINSSLVSGVFPSRLKTAKVVPIHKDGSKLEIENYRPISLLSAFSKIFEKIMHYRVSNFLYANGALYENQYGFRSGRSCEHALLLAQNEITSILNKNQIAILLLIDFSKAFDMVDHKILLHKLQHYGIRGPAYSWFKSYLEGRTQFVELGGKQSSTMPLKYGVPQGSILGPLLFIIYINDIPEVHRLAKFILYADDANIIISGKDTVELQNKFDTLSKTLEIWVSANGLALNLKKTNYMVFSKQKIDLPFKPSISNYHIERKESARFLGVIIDEKLSWKQHISAVKAKMSRYVGVMFKLKGILPLAARKNIFQSFVQSHINYCSLVWGLGPKGNIEPLFCEQKKAMRALMPGYRNNYYKNGKCPCHTKPAFSDYNILTVPMVILKNVLLFMHKVHNFPQLLPPSILNIISEDAPIPGSTHESCTGWLNNNSVMLPSKSIAYKGPLFYAGILPKLILFRDGNITFKSIASFKTSIKKYLHKIQCSGDHNEWCGNNEPLYHLPGLRRSSRNKPK